VTMYFVGYISETRTIVVDSESNGITTRNGVQTICFERIRDDTWRIAERQIARRILYSA
jgi:hypothetical protein